MSSSPTRVPADNYRISVEVVAEKLRRAKCNRSTSTLLIGAGCSVTAGIPSCGGLIDKIKGENPLAYQNELRATGRPELDYGRCMGLLTPKERKDLIEGYVNAAQVNWAHLAIACLMEHGYVGRVMTTNFDNLVARAAALLNIFPGVYDMTLYRRSGRAGDTPISWRDLPPHAIFHLHGQSSGFELLNTDEDLQRHAPHVGDCFRFAEDPQPWIVVGYSGANDPIFKAHIGSNTVFNGGLYWVGYRDEGLDANVHDALFGSQKEARYIPGYDADLFFIQLAQELDCFPPSLLAKPFHHLLQVLDLFIPFPEPGTAERMDILRAARERIQEAIDRLSSETAHGSPGDSTDGRTSPPSIDGPTDPLLQAPVLFLQGDYRAVVDLYENAPASQKPGLVTEASRALFQLGYRAQMRADQASGASRATLLGESVEAYQRALGIRADDPKTLNNLGVVLGEMACLAEGEERQRLYGEAIGRYRKALDIKPDDDDAFYNWGGALVRLAELARDGERRRLHDEADAKLRRAEEIRPGVAGYNLACLAALRGNPEECEHWLRRSREAGKLPPLAHLLGDDDLRDVRDQPWFAAFVRDAYGEAPR